MPIYEYKCVKCGKELEVMHKVTDAAPAECPECKAPGSLEKLVSRTSFQLKGGGWYSDLYASAKKDASSSASASPSPSASATTATAAPSTAGSSSTGGGGGTGGGASGGTTGGTST